MIVVVQHLILLDFDVYFHKSYFRKGPSQNCQKVGFVYKTCRKKPSKMVNIIKMFVSIGSSGAATGMDEIYDN